VGIDPYFFVVNVGISRLGGNFFMFMAMDGESGAEE